MKKRKLLIISFVGLLISTYCNSSLAIQVPSKSKFDDRMQYLSYNGYNVTQINAKVGYVTTINFSPDETIIDVVIGFNLGWEAKDSNNKIFLKPIAYQLNDSIIEPNEKQWVTNLIVTTNKRIYSFDLNLVPETSNNNVYLVNFTYPDEIEKAKKDNLLKSKEEEKEKNVEQALNQFTQPKNWDYSMQVGQNSRTIAPDFAYDDGVRTFLGFTADKSIPSVFYYQGNQEMMSNTSTKITDKYTIIVVHKTAKRFILRSGDQVVGIINDGYGKTSTTNQDTSNKSIKRVIK